MATLVEQRCRRYCCFVFIDLIRIYDLAHLFWHWLDYVIACFVLLLMRGNNNTKYMFINSVWLCFREIDILLTRNREIDMRIERYEVFGDVFFFGDFNVATPQRRSSTHTHSHKHTLTHDWPTVADGSSGSRGVFFGFCKYFWPKKGQQEFFFDCQGVT